MTKSKTLFLLASIVGGILAVGQAGLATAGVDIKVCLGCTLKTVAAGMNAASAGDRVVVGTDGRDTPETYENTNIEMKPGVELISQGDDTPADEYVDPYGQTADTFPVLKRTILTILQGAGDSAVVTMNDTILDGFIIENVAATAPEQTALVKVTDVSPTIQNNIIRANEGLALNDLGVCANPGIMVSGLTAQPLIQDNIIHRVNGPGIALNENTYPTISRNIIYTTSSIGPAAYAPGIGLRGTASAIIIDNNEIFNSRKAGIGMLGPVDSGNLLVIKGNTIRDHDNKAGIRIMGNSDGSSAGVDVYIGGPFAADTNTFSGNKAAIMVDKVGTLTIENNFFSLNGPSGYLEELTEVTIKDNITGGSSNESAWRLMDIATLLIQRNEIIYSWMAAIDIRPSSQPMALVIEENTIIGSIKKAGIFLHHSGITGRIEGNSISGCEFGGLGIGSSMTLEIIDNEIFDNHRGGIHTGFGEETGQYVFIVGEEEDLHLTVRGNKVHHNGRDGYGAGLDLRNASGVIENNLIYKNHRAGIRFGDWIDSIQHNTVVYNGEGTLSGGIVYDDWTDSADPNGPPTPGSPTGSPSAAIPIRNNILVGNEKAGINAGTLASEGATCGDWVGADKRDYNLFSANNSVADSCADYGAACRKRQLALCNENPGEIFAAPLFVDPDNDNYHLQVSSPALGSGDLGVEMGAYGGSNGMIDRSYGVPDSP